MTRKAKPKESLHAAVTRLKGLFQRLKGHVEDVATQLYNTSVDHPGIVDALVKEGFEKSWLETLIGIGQNEIVAEVIWLAADKREILRGLTRTEQRKLITKGVNGKPLSEVTAGALRAAAAKPSKSVPPGRNSKPMPRSVQAAVVKPSRVVPRKFLMLSPGEGLRVGNTTVPWSDIVDVIREGLAQNVIPESVLTDIAMLIGSRCKSA